MPNTVKEVVIDSVRGKLVDILYAADRECNNKRCETCKHHGKSFFCKIHFYIDSLIAHGATFATDNNVGNKWISVKDRLPELIPCSVGTGYSEAVNVLTEGRKVLTAIWDGTEFIADADFWDAEGEKITHWTPVPLPLPKKLEEGEIQ